MSEVGQDGRNGHWAWRRCNTYCITKAPQRVNGGAGCHGIEVRYLVRYLGTPGHTWARACQVLPGTVPRGPTVRYHHATNLPAGLYARHLSAHRCSECQLCVSKCMAQRTWLGRFWSLGPCQSLPALLPVHVHVQRAEMDQLPDHSLTSRPSLNLSLIICDPPAATQRIVPPSLGLDLGSRHAPPGRRSDPSWR